MSEIISSNYASIDATNADKIKQLGCSAIGLLHGIKRGFQNSENQDWLFTQAAPTALCEFLFALCIAGRQIFLRNTLHASLESPDSKEQVINWSLGFLGLSNHLKKSAFVLTKDFSMAASQMTHREPIDIDGLMLLAETFVINSWLREQRRFIDPVIKTWKDLYKAKDGNQEMIDKLGKTSFISELAINGFETTFDKHVKWSSRPGVIENIFQFHDRRLKGLAPKSVLNRARKIFDEYKTLLLPVVLPARPHDANVLKALQKEFKGYGPSADLGLNYNRIQFMENLKSKELTEHYAAQGITLHHGNYFHRADRYNLEHMTPLCIGDHGIENIAIASIKANFELSNMVKPQIEWLARDEVVWDRDQMAAMSRVGETVPIITLRPPLIRQASGRLLSAVIREPLVNGPK